MNLIEIAQKLKSFTDQQLLQAMQRPSGQVPSYLVLAELNRRKEARPNNPPKTTVAQELTEMIPQNIPMGPMPGEMPGYEKGGKVNAPPGDLERIAAERQKEADTQAYWAETVPELDVLGAKTVSDYGYNPPVTMDEGRYAANTALSLSPHLGIRDRGFERRVREFMDVAPGIRGATNSNLVGIGSPTIYVNARNMPNYSAGIGTYNHEMGHVALTPLRESFEHDNKVDATPLEHMVINAMRMQTGLSDEDKKYAERVLRLQGGRLDHIGRSFKRDYAKKAAKYIEYLQGEHPDEVPHRNGVLNSMPYRRVDTAIMQKDVDRYAEGGGIISDYDEWPMGMGPVQLAYDPMQPPYIPPEKGVYQQREEQRKKDAVKDLPGPSLDMPRPIAPPPPPEPPAALRRPGERPPEGSPNSQAGSDYPGFERDPLTLLRGGQDLFPSGTPPTTSTGRPPGAVGSPQPNPTGNPTGSTWHWRQNNPGNIRMTDGSLKAYPGAMPGKDGFLAFQTPEQGLAAIEQTWRHIARSRGVTTPRQIISIYAPKGDGANDPDAYAKQFQKLTGIDPDKPIDLNDAATMQKVRAAVAQIETSKAGPTNVAGKAPHAVTEAKEDDKRFESYMEKYRDKNNPYGDLQKRLADIDKKNSTRKRDALDMALIQAGLGMMASKSPYVGVALGEAGTAALKGYRDDIKGLRDDEMANLSASARLKEAEIAYNRGEFQKAFELYREANANRRHAETLASGTRSISNQFALRAYDAALKAQENRVKARADFAKEGGGLAYRVAIEELRGRLKREPTQAEIDAEIDARLGFAPRSVPGGPAKAAQPQWVKGPDGVYRRQ